MPKPLLTRPETRNLTGTTLSTAPIQQHKLQTQQMNKMELDRYLLQKRSKNYIQTMCELDIGGHVQNQQKLKELLTSFIMNFLKWKSTELCLVLYQFVTLANHMKFIPSMLPDK